MKSFTKYSFIAPVIMVFILFTNTAEVKTKPAAPPTGGVAGDPSRSTCAFTGCHPGPENIFAAGDYDLNFGSSQASLTPMSGQKYTPGQTYFIEFKPKLTNGNNTRYGFQMTSLTSAAAMAGSFTITDATHNSAQTDPLGSGRTYIGHKNASSFNDWIFKWNAPATDLGKLTFYFASDIANGNGSESGDHIYKGTMDLDVQAVDTTNTRLNEIPSQVNSLQLYPNPVKGFVMIGFDNDDAVSAEISLQSMEGKIIQSELVNVAPRSTNNIQYNIEPQIPAGIYLLQIKLGKSLSVRKVIIQ